VKPTSSQQRIELERYAMGGQAQVVQTLLSPFLSADDFVRRFLDPGRSESFGPGSFPTIPDPAIISFIKSLAGTIEIKTQFDPWLTLLSPANFINEGELTARVPSPATLREIKEVFGREKANYQVGLGSASLANAPDTYDLITSFLPFNMRDNGDGNELRPTTDFAFNAVVQVCQWLTENGLGVFLVPDLFFQEPKKSLLSNRSLNLEAVFSAPHTLMGSATRIPQNLVVIRRGPQTPVFIAELSNQEVVNKEILKNYLSKRQGRVRQLGEIVEVREFESFQALTKKKEIDLIERRSGYPRVSISDIALSARTIKSEQSDTVDHKDGSVYIPRVGTSNVVQHPFDMTIKPHNYLQVVLDSSRANPSFVANFMNSEVGRTMRSFAMVGTTIHNMTIQSLKKCFVFLPDIHTQQSIVGLEGRLSETGLQVTELRLRLWSRPRSFEEVHRDLKLLIKEDRLENWIDVLPFPISSILWRYYATSDDSRKVEHLFHFFEALAEFLCMIVLSSLVQDREFYRQQSKVWTQNPEKFKDWYLRASFGSWQTLLSKLAKATRELLDDKKTYDICRGLLGNPSESFLSMITGKGIGKVLSEVVSLRNKWKGHGGITSTTETQDRVQILEQSLNEVRKYISDSFDDVLVMAPISATFNEGVYTYLVRALVGARTPFSEVEIETLIPLDSKRLFLSHSKQAKPIVLLPFIRFEGKSDAVYFYQSVESRTVRWVSYHFETAPELTLQAEESLVRAFEFLNDEA